MVFVWFSFFERERENKFVWVGSGKKLAEKKNQLKYGIFKLRQEKT